MTELESIAFESQAAFEAWLEANHDSAPGVWVRFPRKGSGVAGITNVEAVEAALCFGWIDGQARKGDETWWEIRFTPRRARSKWSQVNVARIARLRAAGRMRPAGEREVERAQADGRWAAAYAPPSTATVPDDLQAALDADPAAAAFFAALDAQNRYAILHRVHDAKRPETRARRIAKFVAMCAAGEGLHERR